MDPRVITIHPASRACARTRDNDPLTDSSPAASAASRLVSDPASLTALATRAARTATGSLPSASEGCEGCEGRGGGGSKPAKRRMTTGASDRVSAGRLRGRASSALIAASSAR